jgi:hypothetical protein
MATKHLFLSDLHFSFKLWANEMTFFNQEIALFEGYLSEIAKRWTDYEVLAELEHYQNQFIIQKEHAEQLAHDINAFQHNMSVFAKDNESVIEHKYFDSKANETSQVAERVETYKSIYAENKKEFRMFLSKYM